MEVERRRSRGGGDGEWEEEEGFEDGNKEEARIRSKKQEWWKRNFTLSMRMESGIGRETTTVSSTLDHFVIRPDNWY